MGIITFIVGFIAGGLFGAFMIVAIAAAAMDDDHED